MPLGGEGPLTWASTAGQWFVFDIDSDCIICFAAPLGFRGKTMSIKDWWVETFAGKVDDNPIYGGLPLAERRNPRKCAAYVAKRVAEAQADAAAHRNSPDFFTPDTSGLKLRIYGSEYILGKAYDGARERVIIEQAFFDVLDSAGKAAPQWSIAVGRLKDEPGIPFYFPTLFANDIEVTWEDYVNAMAVKREKEASEARALAARKAMQAKQKAEEEIARRNAVREERAAIEAKISSLKGEISRLNSMYYNETEFLEKARLMYAVEAREDMVKMLEARL